MVLSMDEIELNSVFMINWIVWNRTVYMYKMDLALNNQQCLMHHKTKPNQMHSFCASLLYSLIMRWIVSFLSSDNLHKQFCIQLVLMALFVPLLKKIQSFSRGFLFLIMSTSSWVQSRQLLEISIQFFSSNLYFLVILFIFIMMILLLMAAVNSIY